MSFSRVMHMLKFHVNVNNAGPHTVALDLIAVRRGVRGGGCYCQGMQDAARQHAPR